MEAGGIRNNSMKNRATGLCSRLRAMDSTIVAIAAYTQKFCEIKAKTSSPNHRFRLRVKSLTGIRSAAGRRAKANTMQARTRMTMSARRCSGMGLVRYRGDGWALVHALCQVW